MLYSHPPLVPPSLTPSTSQPPSPLMQLHIMLWPVPAWCLVECVEWYFLRCHVLEWCYTYYILLYHYSAVLLSYCGTVIYWLVSVVLSYILFSVLALLVAVRCCPSSLQRIFCTPNVLSNRPAFHRLMLICPHSLTILTIFTAAGRPVPVLGLGYD